MGTLNIYYDYPEYILSMQGKYSSIGMVAGITDSSAIGTGGSMLPAGTGGNIPPTGDINLFSAESTMDNIRRIIRQQYLEKSTSQSIYSTDYSPENVLSPSLRQYLASIVEADVNNGTSGPFRVRELVTPGNNWNEMRVIRYNSLTHYSVDAKPTR